jgi:hypothetical protein
MICWTPDITSEALDLSPGHILEAELHFLLDDVLSLRDFKSTHPDLGTLEYAVDPIFHKFTGYHNQRTFYSDENYLQIQV